jgi:translation initiation factor 2B subunit (eIF-2B alpha/beta/delta family)
VTVPVASFLDDRTSGSSSLGERLLAHLERWAAVDTSPDPATFRARLLAELREAQATQPAMALVHRVADRALAVADTGLERGDKVADLRAHLARSCAQEASDLVAAEAAVAKNAAGLLPEGDAWVATLSRSAMVERALESANRAGRDVRALVAEGRPLLEGREQAARLASAGVPVWLVTDAMLPLLLSQATVLWLGADAVTERGVLNKVGSFAAALAARESSVPVYVLAQRRKFIAAATPALSIPEMDGAEVWDSPPEGVTPKNVYFELVPLALVRAVVVEDGVLPPGEAGQVAREAVLPPELKSAT